MAIVDPCKRALLALICAVLLVGCARQALFVVLPNTDDGGAGAITVDNGKSVTTLDQPYAAAESRTGNSAPVEESRGNIGVIFQRAFAAQPILPHYFRLYFILGTDTLTPESEIALRSILGDIKTRPAYQVEAIGHTDTLGDLRSNQSLSLARAAAVRDLLVSDGIDRNAISIAGRGKLDLIVPTADQVAEPRNRCVVVTVR
jgi:outer membrane protein OmpA-like peptidoglycan-associated protein